jgi:hypothetical protein
MADCECLPGCPFFNDKMENKPAMAELYKKQFCRGDSSDCARHRVFKALGKGKVPANLFPSQIEKVAAIIAAG